MHSPDGVSYLDGTNLALSADTISNCTNNMSATNNGLFDMGEDKRFELANAVVDQQFSTSITVPEETLCNITGSFIYLYKSD
jgi:hypothetical protein